MSSIQVRRFARSDRDQVASLVNAHIGAHIGAAVPNVSASVQGLMSQLEGEPGEFIVDPWVMDRLTLVAQQRQLQRWGVRGCYADGTLPAPVSTASRSSGRTSVTSTNGPASGTSGTPSWLSRPAGDLCGHRQFRLRTLGVTAPGATIALAGGLINAVMLTLSGLVQWMLSRPTVPIVRALHDLSFLTGGVAHVVFLGLLLPHRRPRREPDTRISP